MRLPKSTGACLTDYGHVVNCREMIGWFVSTTGGALARNARHFKACIGQGLIKYMIGNDLLIIKQCCVKESSLKI